MRAGAAALPIRRVICGRSPGTEQRGRMSFVDTTKLPVIERLPGWHGRYFDSANMTFGHYDFDAGSSIHGHSHGQEEVWHVIAGELAVTIAGVSQIAGPGCVAIVPPGTA